VSGRARRKRKVERVKGLAATAGLGLAVVCGAALGARADTQAEEVEKGRAFVQANCARCHAIGLDDASPHAKAPPFRIVVERYPSENLAEALAEGIVSGHPDMPVFVLKPEEIEAFLAYLDSLGPTAPAQK
jgi:mono/diheme cytochrome c family protein